MKLAFYAKGDLLVNARPGFIDYRVGQIIPRVGRTHDGNGGYPADEKPFEVEADSKLGLELVRRMRKNKKDPPLYAADRKTAAACGVDFVAVEYSDGAWLPKKPPAHSAKASKPARSSLEGTDE